MSNTSPELKKVVAEADDFLPLLGTDHIELYCGNAKQSAYYYMAAWGFQAARFLWFRDRRARSRILRASPR